MGKPTHLALPTHSPYLEGSVLFLDESNTWVPSDTLPSMHEKRGRRGLLGRRREHGSVRMGSRHNQTRLFIALATTMFVLVIYYTTQGVTSRLRLDLDSITVLPFSNAPAIPKSVHPIDVLLTRGEETFEEMKAGQSKTLEEAVEEYQRRYGRKPPRGFDKWWAYAQEKGIVLVDEFDTIHKDLEPFWGLSPAQIEDRRTGLLQMANSDHLLRLTIRNGSVGDEDGPASTKIWPSNKLYYQLFQGFSESLPDMNLVINMYDQPMGFVSWEERQRLIEAGRKGIFAPDEEEIPVSLETLSAGPGMGFEDIRGACPPTSPVRNYHQDLSGEVVYPLEEAAAAGYRLPLEQGGFVYDVKAASDVCSNPSLRNQHGNYIHPELRVPMKRNRLYPIFSWSRYHASSDITIPTNYRWQYGPADLAKWEDMRGAMAWRGSLTGMYADTAEVLKAQRHRLMVHIQDRTGMTDVVVYNASRGEYEVQKMRKSNGAAWMDVGVIERDWHRKSAATSLVKKLIAPSPRMDNKQRSLFKMLLDVDGWGWSARYCELLRTSSAVVKTTVFHEAVSDWLVPWYHYIPINYDYTDLYSVLLYFFGTEDAEGTGTRQPAHDEQLRAVAERSREWAESQLGLEQQKVYMYRLCLEWARITSEDRDALTYEG